MKSTSKLIVVVLTLFTLNASLLAQTSREQFQTAVVAYQASATEDNARKVAELSKSLNPAPVIPEESEFHALKGAAFVKQAGDAAAFAKAATEFQSAIATAPWVGDYHYNLAVCEKSAGRFSAAQTALKFAQIFARDEKERRDCLSFRAELEAAQELAAAKNDQEQKVAAAKKNEEDKQSAIKAQEQRISGAWKRPHALNDGVPRLEILYVRKTSSGRWNMFCDIYVNNELRGHDVPFRQVEQDVNVLVDGEIHFTDRCYDVTGIVSADGNTLNVSYTFRPNVERHAGAKEEVLRYTK